jgi:hypothetical protein
MRAMLPGILPAYDAQAQVCQRAGSFLPFPRPSARYKPSIPVVKLIRELRASSKKATSRLSRESGKREELPEEDLYSSGGEGRRVKEVGRELFLQGQNSLIPAGSGHVRRNSILQHLPGSHFPCSRLPRCSGGLPRHSKHFLRGVYSPGSSSTRPRPSVTLREGTREARRKDE